jgi:ABC-2 type transport system permease protein
MLPRNRLARGFTLAQRELVRFFRQRNRVFGALGQPIIFWLLFSEGLRGSNLDYAHFFPGTLVMILLFTAIFATISIIEDRNEGFLQSVLVSPAPRWAMVLERGAAPIAMLQGLLFLVLGAATLGLASSLMQVLLAIALMALISIALTALGFLIAWRMDSTHAFHAVMSVFLLPMWLLSGAFFPAGGTGWLAWIVRFNPLTYGVAGLRHYLTFSRESAAAQQAASGRRLPSSPYADRTLARRCDARRRSAHRRDANSRPQMNNSALPSDSRRRRPRRPLRRLQVLSSDAGQARQHAGGIVGPHLRR